MVGTSLDRKKDYDDNTVILHFENKNNPNKFIVTLLYNTIPILCIV